MSSIASLVGRALLAAIFIYAGIGKIGGYEGTAGYMQSFGIPGALLPAVIALELGGGLLLLAGAFSRFAALALAIFTIAAGVIFHGNTADQMQWLLLTKNVAIAGGLLMVFAHGPGRYAVNDQ